ncbi:T6SS phospholipase effector Tle1-like catalytic domain-containing protein [Pseudomonas sp. Hz4]
MSGYVPNPPKNYRYDEAKPVDIHAQRWAEYEKHGKEPAPLLANLTVALRIGVFFDGTGNNANNTSAGLLCGARHPIAPEDIDASCQPFMSDPDSSYGNDVSNVKKLSDLYYAPPEAEGDGQQKIAFRMAYIEGIGTESGEKDSFIGLSAGRGETGIAGCVETAFSRINVLFDDFLKENPDSKISSLTFDTFGFSRGAAAARHFSNEILRCKQGPLGDLLRRNAKAFSPSFSDQFSSGIIMGFIGLFDTVPSIAGLANMGNIKSAIAPGLKLYLDRKYFTDVVQLVARDECRANFALSRVKPAHPEITLPGVHSNIGGGYLEDAIECVLISPMQALDVPINSDVTTTPIYRDAAQVKSQWIIKGWPAELLEIVTPTAFTLPQKNDERFTPGQKRVYAGLQLKRPVSGKLSRVYLRLMYELAKEKGVRFNDIEGYGPDFAVPQELKSMSDRFIKGNYTVTSDEERLLRLHYIHTSANWNHPLGKRDGSGLKAVYINAPTNDAIRVQHPHVPDWTLF